MTDAERMAWLSENAILSKWDHRKGWTVHGFACRGNGPTFAAALDEAIRETAAWHKKLRLACAGTGRTRAANQSNRARRAGSRPGPNDP